MDNKKIKCVDKKIKCNVCKKKNIITFECGHCKQNYCLKHRCPESHKCIYDYKLDLKKEEIIIPQKVIEI